MPSTPRARTPAAAADRKANRERHILNAAVRAFSRHGYHNCSVARVAQEAGVADGTIYLYFKSKEDLLVHAFRSVLTDMLAEMDRRVAVAGEPVEKLLLGAELHFAMMEGDPDLARFLQFQLRQPDEAIRRAIAAPLAEYARRIEAIIDEGKASGAFRSDIGTRVLRRVYFGAVDETVSAWLLRTEGGPLKEKARPLLEVLLDGMRNRAAAPAAARPVPVSKKRR